MVIIVSCLHLSIGIDGIDDTYEMCKFQFVNSTDGFVLTNIDITQSSLYLHLIDNDHTFIVVPPIGRHCSEDIDWKSVYKRAYKIPCNTKLQEFQYKLLNEMLIYNDWLLKWGLKMMKFVHFAIKRPKIFVTFYGNVCLPNISDRRFISIFCKTKEPVKLSVYLGGMLDYF